VTVQAVIARCNSRLPRCLLATVNCMPGQLASRLFLPLSFCFPDNYCKVRFDGSSDVVNLDGLGWFGGCLVEVYPLVLKLTLAKIIGLLWIRTVFDAVSRTNVVAFYISSYLHSLLWQQSKANSAVNSKRILYKLHRFGFGCTPFSSLYLN
jgi:hypothetical protein